jgi:hypothetical protein
MWPDVPEGGRTDSDFFTMADAWLKCRGAAGHGGAGVTLHWGCATDIVRLARDALEQHAEPAHAVAL